MSTSTIAGDEMEKEFLADTDVMTSRGPPKHDFVRRNSELDEALDAEANIEPSTEDPVPVSDGGHDDPDPPPNGGFNAWLQVAGSFFLFFNCWYVLSLCLSSMMEATTDPTATGEP